MDHGRFMETQATVNDITESVRQYILKKFPLARKKSLQPSTQLLESGIVDSLGMLELVSFLEAEFKIGVSDEDLMPENFESAARIGAYVVAKRESATRASGQSPSE